MYYSFWLSYAQLKFTYYYHDLYVKRDEMWHTTSQFIAGGITLVCLFGWSQAPNLSVLWSILIFASQLFALKIDAFNPVQRICASKYYLDDMEKLINEMSYKFREMQSGAITDDSEINSLILHFETEASKLAVRFITPLHFPDNAGLITKADEITNNELEKLKRLGDERNGNCTKTATASKAK